MYPFGSYRIPLWTRIRSATQSLAEALGSWIWNLSTSPYWKNGCPPFVKEPSSIPSYFSSSLTATTCLWRRQSTTFARIIGGLGMTPYPLSSLGCSSSSRLRLSQLNVVSISLTREKSNSCHFADPFFNENCHYMDHSYLSIWIIILVFGSLAILSRPTSQ